MRLPKELDNPEAPLFSIGVVADLLKVADQTLRVYEKSGLIKPSRRNRDRYYSTNDVVWLKCLRRFIRQDGLGLKAIERLIKTVPCYELSPCEECCDCTAYLRRSIPCWESAARQSQAHGQFCCHCETYLREHSAGSSSRSSK
ncbi:MAG: MerR family transcriptional regulator [Acidobacteriota bacterium]